MRFWFDTEFHDDGYHLALISIGVVAEDGREYYAVSADYEMASATQWLAENVVPLLGDGNRKHRGEIHRELQAFFAVGDTPEFWAQCGGYDWVILRQLFGTITDWPNGWPYQAMDIEQWRIQLGAPPFPVQEESLHNALSDARYTRHCWEWLFELAEDRQCR